MPNGIKCQEHMIVGIKFYSFSLLVSFSLSKLIQKVRWQSFGLFPSIGYILNHLSTFSVILDKSQSKFKLILSVYGQPVSENYSREKPVPQCKDREVHVTYALTASNTRINVTWWLIFRFYGLEWGSMDMQLLCMLIASFFTFFILFFLKILFIYS